MITATKNFTVTTRKPHMCDGCGRTFPKGTDMEQIDLCDNVARKFFTSYLCPTCQKIIERDGHEYYVGDYYDKAIDYEWGQDVENFKEEYYKEG